MKKIFKFLLLAIFTISMTSCGTNNDPGQASIIFDSWGDGIDTTMVYKEGYHFHAPWKDMIQYNVRNQTNTYKPEVMDRNGTKVTIVTSVSYVVTPNKIGQLHLKWGQDYAPSFISPKAFGAIKDVAGRYTYEELYSSKREALETEIEAILAKDFLGNYVQLAFVEVSDVNLPGPIANEIVAKEQQKQRNLKSKLMEEEKFNLAQAKIAEAEGNKQSSILNAEAEAESITIKNRALSQSPKYIELIHAEAGLEMAKGITKNGLGNNNVFGSDTFIMKNLK